MKKGGMAEPTMATAQAEPPVLRLGRILVPTDFSDTSRQVLPLAADLAREFGATLELVYVAPTILPAELSHIGIVWEQQRLAAEAKERLASLRQCELPADLTVKTLVLEGGPAYVIDRLARESGADLIITATHGRTGLKHFWLGSTAEHIVRHAPCPVLVVREQPDLAGLPGPALSRFRRILVPTDFSEASDKALQYAAQLATHCGSELSVVCVIEPPPYPEFGYARIPAKEAKLKRAASQKLKEQCQKIGQAASRAVRLIRTGRAHHEIAECAGEERADLVIIATRGHFPLAHGQIGSTAERVVRHAPCSVLVVRERERDFVQT